jgi:superfamily II DNA/RNA helicase
LIKKGSSKQNKMSLKKYNEVLQSALIDAGFENQTEFQKIFISKIKEGKDFIGIGPNGAGKSTAIASGVLQRLDKQSKDDAPRAIVIVTDKVKTLEMEAIFARLGRHMDLITEIIHDKGHKVQQRNALYTGTDIVIGTAKRLYEMYIYNGLNLAKVKMIIIDDAEAILKAGVQTEILRLTESINKCQYIMINDKYTDRMKNASELFMTYPSFFEVEEKLEEEIKSDEEE